jgi:imidazole glycerol-phosphate synthase subunit HisH
MKINVGVIDVGAGNVGAIVNRLLDLDVNFNLIEKPTLIEFTHLILPGVGSFDDFMKKLASRDLIEFIVSRSQYTKILGICVGMHALAIDSEEGQMKGLGLIPGSVKKIETNLPSPHMGWNSIHISEHDTIIHGLNCDIGFYYLHNYKFMPQDKGCIVAFSEYGEKINSIVKKGNIYGAQFHPEKSHDNGLLLFKNFIGL